MKSDYIPHVHVSPRSMEIVPSAEKNLPYISKKNVGSLLDLNCKVEIDEEIICCSHLSSLFTLNSIDCYRNNRKMKVSELFSDEESIKKALPANFKEIHKNIIDNSCGRYIIACDGFGNFLYKIASNILAGEQRFFILHSCIHAMSFKIIRKTKEMEGLVVDSWVVHFFDPNKTNVVSRSEVLSCEEFLDLSRFSLRMFIDKNKYKEYFENDELEPTENECAIYECSDTKNASFNFLTLETMSKYKISGCMIYHMIFNNISSLDIREVVKSRSFSTLNADIRREVFFARSSMGISALQLAMEQNKPNSVRSYNNLLEELSYDEQLSLLPDIIHTKSPTGASALFMAMQGGYSECVDSFGLLLDRLINIRHRIDVKNFSGMLFDILLAKRGDGLSALSMALLSNNADAILAFGSLLDKVFILKDIVDSRALSNIIFGLLSHKDDMGMSGLFYAFKKGNPDAVAAFSKLIDRLLLMKGYVPDTDIADMIFKLLVDKTYVGTSGLFFALQGGHADTVVVFDQLISKFSLLRHSISKAGFNSMMLDILMAARSNSTPGIFISLARNDVDVVRAYSSLLIYAPKEVRREIFCIRTRNRSPALHAFMGHNNPLSLRAYGCFLQALSCDEQIDLLPEILISKNYNGDPALFTAMKEGYSDCIDEYSVLIENQLMAIKNRMSNDDFASLVLDIVFAKISDGTSALFVGMYNNKVSAIESYAGLLGKVLLLLKSVISDDKLADIIYNVASCCPPSCAESPMFIALYRGHGASIGAFGLLVDKLMLMKDYISHDKLSDMIFKLLKARTNENVDGLFMALQEGNTDSVISFGFLLSKFISMKEYIKDTSLLDMVFDLLICKSSSNNIPGLFMAMQNGHYSTVDAFRELLEKIMIFRDDVLSEYFNSMLLETVISKRPDGISGLFIALKNNCPEVVMSYGLLLNLIPKYELVNVLVASNSSGIPAALFAGKEALDSYLKIISYLPSGIKYTLYLRLSRIRISIRHTSLNDSDLDGRYKLLLEKVKGLAIGSVGNVVIT
ncbi:ShET2/EspL2 family type III secretion system effector toxin [Candidatus Ichthyocystis sparus]|uniref:ShET2/EspL2 family type III secretion system effector toxin n=1 Tax=Candidatus Ichthyocystis sparus TaxID=1561004 RepID=UPI000B873AC8|nr:ShET2/EspL2 family type III secretion system effector toxin [Candidatus Ichthyocystis sparus]